MFILWPCHHQVIRFFSFFLVRGSFFTKEPRTRKKEKRLQKNGSDSSCLKRCKQQKVARMRVTPKEQRVDLNLFVVIQVIP